MSLRTKGFTMSRIIQQALFSIVSFTAVAGSLAATGCSKSSGDKCSQVVAHVSEVTKIELTEERKTKGIEKCRKAPPAVQDCMLKADSLEAVAACNQH